MEIGGFCDERFAAVRAAFENNFKENGDVGACFALTVEGEPVIDLWGGYRNADRTLPWEEDTIVNVYSTTKTMSFLVALMLADQGKLDFDAPVARYWPEFAQNGKDSVLVRHLMAHSAGLPGFSEPATLERLGDWTWCVDNLAAQAPWWEPGTASGYHAITQGYLIGEVVRRITGQTIGNWFREHVAEPLDADFHIGVPARHFDRIADLIPAVDAPPAGEMDPESIPVRVFGNMQLPPDATRTAAWRQAEMPAANGHGNARSVVRSQTAMANGGRAFGKQLLSAQGAARALEDQISGLDKVIMMPLRFALGYGRNNELIKISPNENALWWGGAGGSTIVVDQDAHVCFSYVMNQMRQGVIGDQRGASLGAAVYASLN